MIATAILSRYKEKHQGQVGERERERRDSSGCAKGEVLINFQL